MSLTNPAALSGINLARRQIENLQDMIANSRNPDYIKGEITYSTQAVGNKGQGVALTGEFRVVEQTKIEARRTATNDERHSFALSESLKNLVYSFGNVNDGTSLYDKFITTLDHLNRLSENPENVVEHKNFLKNVSMFLTELNSLANSCQMQRAHEDAQISSSLDKANTLLKRLQSVNDSLKKDNHSINALNERDRLLKEISQYLNIKTKFHENNTVEIFDQNNRFVLLNALRASTLHFDPTTTMSPEKTFIGGELSGIYLDGDPAKDMTNSITGGEIAAHLYMRDTKLPQVQDELDAFAQKVKDIINPITNCGSYSHAPQILKALNAFTPSDSFGGSGNIRIAIVNNTTKRITQTQTLDLSNYTTFAELGTALNAIPGMSATFDTDDHLVLTTTSNAEGIIITPDIATPDDYGAVMIGSTVRSFSHAFGFNDLVTSSTDGIGISNSLKLNDTMLGEQLPSLKVNPNAGIGDIALNVSNADSINELRDELVSQMSFDEAGALKSHMNTLAGFISAIYTNTSNDLIESKNIHESQAKTLQYTEDMIQSIGGVNLKEALTQLQSWLQYLKANTTSLSMNNKLIDIILEKIG